MFYPSAITLPLALLGAFQLHTASAIALPAPTVLPYDITVFQHAAVACQQTNCGDEMNKPGTKLWDMVVNSSIPYAVDGEQRVNLYTSDEGIIVAYEGMNGTSFDSNAHVAKFWLSKPDNLLGLSSRARVYTGIHEQFLRSWEKIKDPLAALIHDHPDQKVLVAGHSLGAAMCQFAALAIQNTFGNVISNVISLGPPRAGNPAYAADFDKVFMGRAVHVINGEDFIPRLPPTFMGYQHPSGLLWINPSNSTNYYYYQNGEDRNGPDGNLPKFIDINQLLKGHFDKLMPWGDHLGWYFGVYMGGRQGRCPAPLPFTPV